MPEEKKAKSKKCSIIALVLIPVNLIAMVIFYEICNSLGAPSKVYNILAIICLGLLVAGIVNTIMAMVYNSKNPLAIVTLVLYCILIIIAIMVISIVFFIVEFFANAGIGCSGMGAMLFY